jgi:hypothetical protein
MKRPACFNTAVLKARFGTRRRSPWSCFACGWPTGSTTEHYGAGTIVALWPGCPAMPDGRTVRNRYAASGDLRRPSGSSIMNG